MTADIVLGHSSRVNCRLTNRVILCAAKHFPVPEKIHAAVANVGIIKFSVLNKNSGNSAARAVVQLADSIIRAAYDIGDLLS